MPDRMLRKCALKVRMARLDMLHQWMSGGYLLVCSRPDVGDVAAIFLAGFVVKYLVVDGVTVSLEAVHDAGVGGYAVAIFSCLEWFNEDGICIVVKRHHQVLIAAAWWIQLLNLH